MVVYRLHRSVRPAADFTGALLAGGRWNPAGTAMLYAAQSLSLACLEILVHLDKSQVPLDYVWSSATLPHTPESLSVRDFRDANVCQAEGRKWAESGQTTAVTVRSVIIPEEVNILLNPAHPEFDQLNWTSPRPFKFDRRLFTLTPQID